MRSKIQISVTEESKPCILVEYLESQDVRDTLVKQFKEGFQSVSSLCKVEFRDNQMIITPVAPLEPLEKILAVERMCVNDDCTKRNNGIRYTYNADSQMCPRCLRNSGFPIKTNSVSSTGGDNMSVTYLTGDSITYTK